MSNPSKRIAGTIRRNAGVLAGRARQSFILKS